MVRVSRADLVAVLRARVPVPDTVGIAHHVGPLLAAVEAPRGIGADILDPQLPCLLAHIAAQFLDTARFRGAGRAKPARMPLSPRIGADENMPVEKQPRIGERI